ncbi:mitochondrial 2-oxodicarboxylate carrier [Octopus bimaculoides]|uniref:mitochondrial 2-oxodicarboxylate carrier n=1 Tax=Octopus bimaculoides TaxID=37653 RepID=UPI0022DF869A|nr:mitochondrial 2-oxodicarboxylate carrier [Octopus bimaculoides]
MSTTHVPNVYLLPVIQFASGGCAGLVEVSLMHPLDLIKTRFQIQRGPDDPNRYTSLYDCFKKISRNEGVLTLAGLFSGLTEAVIINPFEVVKVKLQAERDNIKGQKSTVATAREIFKEHGFGRNGLNKGLTSTLGRHGIFNMIYFSLYHNVKNTFPETEDKVLDFLKKFTVGFISGVLGSCANIPFDVAKSRIQGPQPVPGEIKYQKCFQSMHLIYKEEGYFALYKGLVPKVLRLGPGAAIMMIVYEHVFDWLKKFI